MTPSPSLKSLVWRLPHPILMQAHRGLVELRTRPNHELTKLITDVPALSALDLSSVKQSQTVFVLGSGLSINRIGDERWKQIRESDSVGMNFWIAHEHRPTFYFFELILPGPAEKPEDSADEMLRLHLQAAHSRPDYNPIPKVVLELQMGRLAHWRALPPAFRKNCYSLWNPIALARDQDELAYLLKKRKQEGMFSRPRVASMFKSRGSLPTVIGTCLAMGYRNVVLCGIDLKAGYFFHDERKYPLLHHFRRPAPGSLHPTAQSNRIAMGMKDVILAMDSFVARPNGQRLWVESADSGLHPEVPVFPTQSP